MPEKEREVQRRGVGLAATALAVAATLAFLALPASAQPFTDASSVRLHEGEEPRWAEPSLDDSSWKLLPFGQVPESGGIVVLRARIRLAQGNLLPGRPTGVLLAALASCEVAWDGVVIGRSGRPAATASGEIAGPVQAQWVIPERLSTPGEHLVALRCSAHHRGFRPSQGYWILIAGDYDALREATLAGTWIALASLSGMGMVAVFALALFLTDRRDRSFLLLGLVCLTGGALLLAESWRNTFGYTYDRHFFRLLAVTGLTGLLNLVIAAFVVVRFPDRSPRRARAGSLALAALLLALGAALFHPTWDGKALLMFLAGLGLTTVWTARAAWRRERGGLAALLGLGVLLAALLWRPAYFADWTFFLALDFLLLCLLVAHALQTRHLRREHEYALVRSARLEIELLRRQIQPHFLLNTLTALSEWIEREPKVAVGLVEAIAEELRLLGRIADQRLIPLGEELALCRTHIEVMSRRRDREYALEVTGADPLDLVPPALFHTLVENAITHDASKRKNVVLTLRAEAAGAGQVRYVFSAPDEEEGNEGVERKDGTGLRYIRARLEESLGSDWTLAAGPAGGSWRTVLTIPRRR